MKKSLKLMGMIGITFSLMMFQTSVPAHAENVAKTGVKIHEVINDIKGLMKGWPILDVTSVPAHAVVAIEQEFIRMRTEIEDELKNQIKERITATKDNQGNKIDTKLSNAKVPSQSANESVSEGIVGKGLEKGDKGEIEQDAEETTYDLSMQQQANWTSSAGSLGAKEEYAKKRAYIEQEQAIRLLGTIGVLRKNLEEKLLGQDSPIKQLEANYGKSDAKKDLDPQGKSGSSGKNALDSYKTVEKTNDYNQVFRQYALHGLVYDQMLSLEQQVLGLRLQAIAGKNAQDMNPLTDKLDINTQSDEASEETGK